jgi:PAS domain S-box-containing protein
MQCDNDDFGIGCALRNVGRSVQGAREGIGAGKSGSALRGVCVLNPANYAFSPFAVPTFIAAAVSLALGVWLVVHERYSRISWSFMLTAVAVAVWLFGMSGVYCSNNAETALAWQKVTFFGVPFIPPALYHFSVSILGLYERRRRFVIAAWFIAATFMTYALAADGVFTRMQLRWWGYYPIYGYLGIPFLLFYGAVFAACWRDYWTEYNAAEPGRRKERVRLLLIAFSISYFGATDFLPTYGVDVYPIGYVGVFVCLGLAAYTVQRYRLIDIIPEFAANQIINTIADSLVVCDADAKIRVVNNAACETLGYRAEELLWKPISFLVGSSRSAAHRIGELLARPTVRDEEFVFWTRDGEPVDVSLSVSRIDDLDQGLVGSVVIAHDIRERKQSQERLQEEVDIASALARVGGQLISVLDRPVLLEHLCELTCGVLQADASYTLLWDPKEDVFTPVASYGATAEEREIARLIQVPRSMMEVLFGRFEHDDVAESRTVPAQFMEQANRYVNGPPHVCIALRRGEEIIGIQVAAWRGAGRSFSSRERRIARGISQLASFALENARLMAELNEADKLRSEFVATMSHELRTPLGVIIGYTDLLLDRALGGLGDEQDEALQRVRKNSWDLLELISSTLDLSRLQRGRLPLCLTETNLSSVLQQIQEETSAHQDKPGVAVHWRVPDALPPIHTDPSKLKVVLKNLVLNALKFTDDGEVVVEASAGKGGVECCVRDTGIGIAPELVGEIFEPFRQVNGNGKRQYGGVGLGLYIARRFLDMLGGRIEVQSAPGAGSVFRVWVPHTAVADADEA